MPKTFAASKVIYYAIYTGQKKLGIMNFTIYFRVKFDMTMIFLIAPKGTIIWPPFKPDLTVLPQATTELSSVEYDNPLK